MSDLELIAPAKTLTVSFALDPVQNAITDLVMLTTADTSGFADWIKETADAIPEELMETTRRVVGFIWSFVDNKPMPSFPAWLEYIESKGPFEIRDEAVEELLTHAHRVLGDEVEDIPDAAQILEDEEVYLGLMKRIYQAKGKDYEDGCCDYEYDFYRDPVANHKLAIDHLKVMWEKYLGPEWERNVPILEESIAAFETIDFSGKSFEEILRLVADREVPDKWEGHPDDIYQVVFVPSPHIGPYLIGAFGIDRLQVTFGARIPKGASIASPALSRSELITRLNALADDTRLRILSALAQEGEMGAQEIISKLSLSQSAASRHLRQLTATGYLVEQRREGAKSYRLNPSRIEDAFSALRDFLG